MNVGDDCGDTVDDEKTGLYSGVGDTGLYSGAGDTGLYMWVGDSGLYSRDTRL